MLRFHLKKLRKAMFVMYKHLKVYVNTPFFASVFFSRKPLRALDTYNDLVLKFPYLGLSANRYPRKFGFAEVDMLQAFYNSASISLNICVKKDAMRYLRLLGQDAPTERIRDLANYHLLKLSKKCDI